MFDEHYSEDKQLRKCSAAVFGTGLGKHDTHIMSLTSDWTLSDISDFLILESCSFCKEGDTGLFQNLVVRNCFVQVWNWLFWLKRVTVLDVRISALDAGDPRLWRSQRWTVWSTEAVRQGLWIKHLQHRSSHKHWKQRFDHSCERKKTSTDR